MAELQERMGSAEFAEWLAYERINPWGMERDDMRIAMMTAALVNTIRGAIGAKGKPSKVSDFMLDFEPPKTPDPESMTRDMWDVIHRAVGVKPNG